MIGLEEESKHYGYRKGVHYRCLSCTRWAPELRHFAALETTTKGVIKHIDFCVCIAWWMVIVGKIAKCFRGRNGWKAIYRISVNGFLHYFITEDNQYMASKDRPHLRDEAGSLLTAFELGGAEEWTVASGGTAIAALVCI